MDPTTDAAFRAKTLRSFTDGEVLRSIPARQKPRLVVLEWLLERFEAGQAYPEREVNELIARSHEDTATLRRELVEWGYLERTDGIYRVAGGSRP